MQLTRTQMKFSSLMVSGLSAINCTDPDGVVLWSEPLHVGRHKLAQWLPFLPEDAICEIEGDVYVVTPQNRLYAVPYGEGSHDTGANPDFVVTSASRYERELKLTMDRLNKRSDLLDRKLSAMEGARSMRAEAARAAAEPEPVAEVLEPVNETNEVPADEKSTAKPQQ